MGAISTLSTICTDWYWVTTYSDGTQTWEYLYTRCVDDCTLVPTVNLKNGVEEIKTFCGGVSPIVNECGMTLEDIANNLNHINPTNNGSISTSGGETVDINTGIIRKAVQERWNFCTFSVLTIPVNYIAYFTGTIYKSEPNVPKWKYESFGYSSTFEEGTSAPCLDITTNTVVNAPVISSDSLRANGLLSYNIVVKISCLGGFKAKTVVGNNLTANWNANN